MKAERLFVYGTLRSGGVAHHMLKDARVIAENYCLPGFALYNAGWYPVAIIATASSGIWGDVVEVSSTSWRQLDIYEGPEYQRLYVAERGFWLYLYTKDPTGMPPIPHGDWLKWVRTNGYTCG